MNLRLRNPMREAIWLSFLLPSTLLGAAGDRVFGAAVFLLACAVLYTKPSPWEARDPSAAAVRFALAIEAAYLISAVYSAGFNGSGVGAAGAFELLRFIVLGGFAAYLIRHFDAAALSALEWAAASALYASLLYPPLDPQGFAALLTLCWLLFFSRLRLRLLHASTALLVVCLGGDAAARAGAFSVLAAGASLLVYRALARRRARGAARLSALLYAGLLAGGAVLRRALAGPGPEAVPSVDTVALQFIRRSPVFGWGPVDPASMVGRSQYLFWLLKQGALGAGLIAAALVYAGYRLLRAASGEPARLAGAASFVGSVALMLTAGRFFESDRLFFLAAFFAAGMHEASR
jgi:hypothetical protein